ATTASSSAAEGPRPRLTQSQSPDHPLPMTHSSSGCFLLYAAIFSSAISRPPERSSFRAEAASPTNTILPPATARPRTCGLLAGIVTTGPTTTRSAGPAQETPPSPIQIVRPATSDRAHRLG